jgi:hypothetical protein
MNSLANQVAAAVDRYYDAISTNVDAANRERAQAVAGGAREGVVTVLDITLGETKIGEATVNTYELYTEPGNLHTLPGEYYGVTISITPTITDPAQQGFVYRWRQTFSITDQAGNFLPWPDGGPPANGVVDRNPLRPNIDWYFSDIEWRARSKGGNAVDFYDQPLLHASRLGENVSSIQMSFNLQLVQVTSIDQATGGTPVFSMNWGFQFTNASQTLIPISSP